MQSKEFGSIEELAQLKKDAIVWLIFSFGCLIAEIAALILLNRAALPFMFAFFILIVLAEYEYRCAAERLTAAMRQTRKGRPST